MIEWRDVVGFPDYEVSEMGEVRRKGGTRSLRWAYGGTGYAKVNLYRNGATGRGRKQKEVHRIVIEAFAGPAPEGQQARHLNGDRRDNRAVNLAWGTPLENAADKEIHGTQVRGVLVHSAVLNEQAVRAVRILHTAGMQQKDIAEALGVHPRVVGHVVLSKTWRHVA